MEKKEGLRRRQPSRRHSLCFAVDPGSAVADILLQQTQQTHTPSEKRQQLLRAHLGYFYFVSALADVVLLFSPAIPCRERAIFNQFTYLNSLLRVVFFFWFSLLTSMNSPSGLRCIFPQNR